MFEFLAPTRDYQPDDIYTFGNNRHYQSNQQVTATLIGLVAFALPIFMILYWRWQGDCFRDSLSHFYYSPFPGAVFVAALAFVGTFLFAYRGETPAESFYSWFAGAGALGVALFPTTGTGCEAGKSLLARAFVEFSRGAGDNVLLLARPNAWFCEAGDACQVANPVVLAAGEIDSMFQLFPLTGLLHYLSAAVLFAFLAWYCFRVFPRVVEDRHCEKNQQGVPGKITTIKLIRNSIYYASGVVIVLASAAMVLSYLLGLIVNITWWYTYNMTFWCEAAALWAFGLSWVVKGRLFGLVLNDKQA